MPDAVNIIVQDKDISVDLLSTNPTVMGATEPETMDIMLTKEKIVAGYFLDISPGRGTSPAEEKQVC